MESISNVKVATYLKKEAKKVQRQKTFFLLKYHLLLFSAGLSLEYKYEGCFDKSDKGTKQVPSKLLRLSFHTSSKKGTQTLNPKS